MLMAQSSNALETLAGLDAFPRLETLLVQNNKLASLHDGFQSGSHPSLTSLDIRCVVWGHVDF
jgi:hypothetical protein